MPSGAKKRKAAKKRKENHPNSSHPGGDDGQSDIGEISARSSMASHTDLLTEGEEEKIEKVEREFKIEHEFDKKNGMFKHNGRSSRSSSRSSSDNESHTVKANPSLPTIKVGEPNVESNTKKGSVEEQAGVQEKYVDAVSHLEETTTPYINKTTTNSDPKPSVVEDIDDQLSLPYSTPIAHLDTPSAVIDNEADGKKEIGINEPLLVPVSPPRPVERASWKNCCGLFELFTESGR